MTDDIVERAKQSNRIEDVIEADGFPLQQRGRYRRCPQHDSLVVDVDEQAYFWNSKSERGDVITWLENRHGLDFKSSIEWLCRKANLPEPEWNKQDVATRLAQQAREDALEVAARIFVRWLWKSPQALAYARGRGWTDDTIQACFLGFSGSGTDEERKEMTGELSLAGVDLGGPAAAAVLGVRGNVAAWAERNGLREKISGDWIEKGYIPGMLGQRRLVYAHVRSGKIRYLSGRSIEEKRHHNLPESLVGERLPFFNHVYGASADSCVIVEGQADAISLGQLGQAAVALAGVALSPEIARQFHHSVLYTGLDDDQAGENNAWKVANSLGPLTRLVRWGGGEYRSFLMNGETVPVKDANDLLRAYLHCQVEPAAQKADLSNLLKRSKPLVEVAAAWAGIQEGADRDKAEREVCKLIAQLKDVEYAQYKDRLARALDRTGRQLDALIKTIRSDGKEAKEKELGEPVEIVGGYIGEHLIELLYDPEEDTTQFAVRFPDGHVDIVDHVLIDGTRYIPLSPIPLISRHIVSFPSALPSVRSTREMVAIVRAHIHRYLDVDMFYERLAAYYVLFSWLYDCFTMVPYLRALGDYGTGKTRFIETIGFLCYRPIHAAGVASTSSIFRMLELFRGTLILDEADFAQSDETQDIIKILNIGNKKGGNVIRTMDLGGGNLQPVPYDVFCPKVIATRKKFGDEATESRCLTKEMGGATVREDIPIVEPKEYLVQAREIRNMLLAYRLKHWIPEFEINYNAADRAIEPRLNQVTLPLKTLVGEDEPELMEEIDGFIRRYNQQLVVERSMRPEAKVLEAIVTLAKNTQPQLDGTIDLTLKDIAAKANEIMDKENEEEEDESKGKRKITPKGAGSYLRTKLNLNTYRKDEGYHLVWDEQRIESLKRRYGLDV